MGGVSRTSLTERIARMYRIHFTNIVMNTYKITVLRRVIQITQRVIPVRPDGDTSLGGWDG